MTLYGSYKVKEPFPMASKNRLIKRIGGQRSTRPASLKSQVSSGGVLYKKQDGQIEVVMIVPKGRNVLTLPKGLLDEGEEPYTTALREVREETGLSGRIIEKIGEVSYWFYIKEENVRCKKTVHYFLMEYEKGDTRDHDWEVQEVLWLPIDEAIQKATYKTDREILKKAKELIIRNG